MPAAIPIDAPVSIIAEAPTALLVLGGVDARGDVRMVAVDEEGRVVCSPSHAVHRPRGSQRAGPLNIMSGLVRLDSQGRVICAPPGPRR